MLRLFQTCNGRNNTAGKQKGNTSHEHIDSAKKTTPLFLTALVLVCLTLSPRAQAVVPAPDGGYPGGNTAEGQSALLSLTTGGFNTAVGWFSLRSNATGTGNTAIGAGALFVNTDDDNTATGAGALLSNTSGAFNTANGAFALLSNTTGTGNTASGENALLRTISGSHNTATGEGALINNTTGHDNIALGVLAGGNVVTAGNVICIGVSGENVDNSCYIGNIRGVTTNNADAIPVLIDSTGQLGTMSSSSRFKKEIKPMDKASESILALKPVTFHYKSDKTNKPEFGLIAEQVAEVNPDLVVRDKDGQIYTVRYDAVNAMLLNEFLKEHRKVEKLEAMVAQQQRDFENAVAEMKGQIQKVSAQLELNKSAPQTVLNSQ